MNCKQCGAHMGITGIGDEADYICISCDQKRYKEAKPPVCSIKSIKKMTHDELLLAVEAEFDAVNKPKHYNSHPSGIECIEITRHMPFNIGNAIKYLWRFDNKNGVEDLKKAVWYIQDQIKLLETEK